MGWFVSCIINLQWLLRHKGKLLSFSFFKLFLVDLLLISVIRRANSLWFKQLTLNAFYIQSKSTGMTWKINIFDLHKLITHSNRICLEPLNNIYYSLYVFGLNSVNCFAEGHACFYCFSDNVLYDDTDNCFFWTSLFLFLQILTENTLQFSLRSSFLRS